MRPYYFTVMGYARELDKISKANPHPTFIHLNLNPPSRNSAITPANPNQFATIQPQTRLLIPESFLQGNTKVADQTPHLP